MTIKKEVDGTYTVRVASRCEGKYFQKIKKRIKKKADANFYENKFSKLREEWKNNLKNKVLTWQVALDEYLAEAELTLAPSTFLETRSALLLHTKVWNHIPIEDLHKNMVLKHIQKVHAKNSESTKKQLAKYIRNVFKVQVDNGEIKRNPALGLKFSNKEMKNNRLIAMTKSEIQTLLKEATLIDHPWHDIWYLTYQAGLRSGEAYALKEEHIDFENKHIHILQSYDFKTGVIGPTKNRKTRIVPINTDFSHFLKQLVLKAKRDEFLLPRINDWKNGNAAKILKSFQKDLGIRETNFHSLRASFITHLLLDGVSMTKVQQIVGHEDLKTTARYVRMIASDLQGATDSIGISTSDLEAAKILTFSRET